MTCVSSNGDAKQQLNCYIHTAMCGCVCKSHRRPADTSAASVASSSLRIVLAPDQRFAAATRLTGSSVASFTVGPSSLPGEATTPMARATVRATKAFQDIAISAR